MDATVQLLEKIQANQREFNALRKLFSIFYLCVCVCVCGCVCVVCVCVEYQSDGLWASHLLGRTSQNTFDLTCI